jgi:hypothetical protein
MTTSKEMTWTDHPGGSVRSDGAKVGEFCINGKFEWWAYPAGWYPRCTIETLQPLGPFFSRKKAKQEMDYHLGIPA